ncbi:MAG: VOC family protein [Kiloniellales bacterium]|nr:VOC family protein [Kiloniellales bacterium]
MTRFKTAVPVIPVSDIDKLARFYAEVAGFEIDYAEADYAILARDEVELHLWAATDESWKLREPGKPVESGAESFLAGTASCRVRVDDIESLYAAMQRAEVVHPNGKLEDKPYGLREFSILDPDNNLMVFFQPSS